MLLPIHSLLNWHNKNTTKHHLTPCRNYDTVFHSFDCLSFWQTMSLISNLAVNDYFEFFYPPISSTLYLSIYYLLFAELFASFWITTTSSRIISYSLSRICQNSSKMSGYDPESLVEHLVWLLDWQWEYEFECCVVDRYCYCVRLVWVELDNHDNCACWG